MCILGFTKCPPHPPSSQVTAFSTVPTLLACLDPASAPSLRLIIVGGEACAQSVVDAWAPGRRFFNTYGPTEATVVATFHKCEPGLARGERMKIGRPLANVQCYVLDDRLSPVPQGALGELYIGGVGVSSRGYLGLPAMTAERFVPDPFVGDAGGDGRALLYKTGDLVRQVRVLCPSGLVPPVRLIPPLPPLLSPPPPWGGYRHLAQKA